jgi:proline dehydrogenase
MGNVPFYAKRFISGTNRKEAFDVVEKLNKKNISVTLDLLGENIKEKTQALRFLQEYEILIQEIAQNKKDCSISIKLSMLGLDIDSDFCYENLCSLLKIADSHHIRVAFDMEGSNYTERILGFYEKTAQQFKSPEIVLQAYLLRTETDVNRALTANKKIRLCKGAYKEPPDKALQQMSFIVENYKKLIHKLLFQGNRVCIATHDDELIRFCLQVIKENKISQDRYEFQMLYGMREHTWKSIQEQGHNMTVYVPYGENWHAYYARRLSERKENIFFFLKNLFRS